MKQSDSPALRALPATHAQSASDVLTALGASRHGLTRAEADARLAHFGHNALPRGAVPTLLAVFLAVYVAITPYKELSLIREGNAAAAISLAGAIVGFVLPLARAVTQSVSALDLVAWGGVALVVQVVVFFLVGKLVPRFAEAIKEGRVAAATLLAALAVAVGMLNAAAMTS